LQRKIIKVLIAYNEPKFLRYLAIEIPRKYGALGVYAHIITASTFTDTVKAIEQAEIDVYCIDFNWENERGHGEDLITLIKKTAPHQTVIAIMDDEEPNYQVIANLANQYYPILAPTKTAFFADIKGYLEKSLLHLSPYTQIVTLDTRSKTIRFYLEEIAYLYGHDGQTTVFVYNSQINKYQKIKIPISITNFLAKYDKSGIFIRCHRDYAVNHWMIRFVHKPRAHRCIELIYKDERDYPVEIPISDSYSKQKPLQDLLRPVKGVVLI